MVNVWLGCDRAGYETVGRGMRITSDEHATLSGGHYFRCEQEKRGDISKRPGRFAPQARSMSVRGILDQEKSTLVTEPADHRKARREVPTDMHHHHSGNITRTGGLNRPHISEAYSAILIDG